MATRLVVAPAWLGDMIMAQSLFIVLKKKYPQDPLHVIAPASTLPLVARMPEVTRACLSPTGHGKLDLRARFQLGRSLRSQHYQEAFVLANSLKSALIPYFANIPRRIGWLGEYRWGLLNDARYGMKRLPKMVQRLVALAYPAHMSEFACPKPALLVDESNVRCLQDKWQLAPGRVVVLAPGAAFGEAKRWPQEYFAKLALMLLDSGRQVWIAGGPSEQPLARVIQEHTHGRCVDLTAKTSLTDVVDVMSMADYVVCNDSGLMHMAAALSKPMVVIYGSSDHHFTPPLSDDAHIMALDLPCRPCFKRTCPLLHLQCLRLITPEHIFEKIKAM